MKNQVYWEVVVAVDRVPEVVALAYLECLRREWALQARSTEDRLSAQAVETHITTCLLAKLPLRATDLVRALENSDNYDR